MATAPDPISVAAARRIDAVCDRFEADWKAGRNPRIEDYVGSMTGREREELVRTLLQLELELLVTRQLVPEADGYKKRFPEHAPLIEALVESAVRRTTSQQEQGPPAPAPPASPVQAVLPQTVGRFLVLERLGQGAFGQVFRARDPQLDRDVAIKIPLPGTLKTPRDAERFLREARAAANIHHPNICPVYEVGQFDSQYYIVMALIHGQTLAQMLKARPGGVAIRQAVTIVRKLALALDVAHAKGIIHRDLKPGNILFDRERKDVVIMDFGLARRTKADDATRTQEGTILGSPAYMSPEQARGDVKAIGPLADVYSLGVILYELLTGRLPFTGSVNEVLGKVLHVAPEPLSKVRPGLDLALEAICLKALAKEPVQRFGSMKQFADALSDYQRGAAVETTPERAMTTQPAVAAERQPAAPLAESLFGGSKPDPVQRQPEPQPSTATIGRRRRWPLLLVGGGFLGALILLGIILVFRTPTATILISDEYINPNDHSLSYILDGDDVTVEELQRPITLMDGEHKLYVRRNGQAVYHYRFQVSGGGRVAGAWEKVFAKDRPKVLTKTPAIVSAKAQIGSPVAHFTFDGPPESLAVDRTGQIKGAKIVGDVKQAEGKFGKAASFPGNSTSYIELPDQPALRLKKQATLACWVKVAPEATGGSSSLIRKWYGPDSYLLLAGPGQAEIRFGFPTGEAWGRQVGVRSVCRPNTWTHVAGVYDGEKVRLYLDGKPAQEARVADVLSMRTSKIFKETGKVPNQLTQSSKPVWLGYNLKGLLDEVMIFNVALTPEQIAKLAGVESPPLGQTTADQCPDRRAALWALGLGDVTLTLSVNGTDRFVRKLADLPPGPFRLVGLELAERQAKGLQDSDLARLQGATDLRFLSLDGGKYLTDAALPHLRGLAALESLRLDHAQVTDRGLEHLGGLSNLSRLVLASTKVTGPGLAHLKNSMRLNVLWLSHAPVTNEGVKHLRALTELEHLRLDYTAVTDACLDDLQALNGLRHLDLRQTKVSSDGLRKLRQALPGCEILPETPTGLKGPDDPNRRFAVWLLQNNAMVNWNNRIDKLPPGPFSIETIEGSRCPALTDDLLARNAAALTHLKMIHGNDMKLTGTGFAAFKDSHLEIIDMPTGSINDAGLEAICGIPSLKKLELSSNRVGDAGLAHLQKLPKLWVLDLGDNKVTDKGMPHLAKCPQLRMLNLSGNPIGDAGFAHLAALKLKSLALAGTKITDDGLAFVKGMTDLEDIEARNTAIGDAGLAHLVGLKSMQRLRFLSTKIAGPGLKHLAGLPNLVLLDLSDSPVDDAAIPNLLALQGLRELYLTGTRVSPAGLKRLREGLPGCQITP